MSGRTFDSDQQNAIDAYGGYYLVLAPPGCGKTEILAERIVGARQRGVGFDEMLCLTFTNRASRSMRNRVLQSVGEDACELFVGNIHRFCSTFLYRNQLIAENTSIIDEDDQADIMQYLDDYFFIGRNGLPLRSKIKEITDLENYLVQRRLNQPEEVLRGGDKRKVGDPEYSRFEEYYQKALEVGFDESKVDNSDVWKRLKYALQYHDYKQQRLILDFSDLLIYAYEELRKDIYPKYRWIQIDEVQDLNALQLAIIDSLTEKEEFTVMYLGDEQQAIYSFLGAKLQCLDQLRLRCKGHVFSLGYNYRSPKYLLDIYNTYASTVLGVGEELLPEPFRDIPYTPRDLILAQSASASAEMERVLPMIRHYMQYQDEQVAVLVSTNADADNISDILSRQAIAHFKISGMDMFRSRSYKTFASLFSVTINPFNSLAWVRLLHGTGAISRLMDARNFVAQLKELNMTPLDLLISQPEVMRFYEVYGSQEVVLFDTETTGLDVLHDDIVQIAAFKVRRGKKVEGSDFNIILETDKEIPSHLGDIENPLVEEYTEREHETRVQGLRKFLEYVGDLPLMGHNVRFDYLILRNNVLQVLGEEVSFHTIDSLHIIKCINPGLHSYKLGALLQSLNLDGSNSHLANEDIEATKSLLDYCLGQVHLHHKAIERFLAQSKTRHLISRLQPVAALMESLQSILDLPVKELKHDLADVMQGIYKALMLQGIIGNLGNKFDIFLRFVRSEWQREDIDCTLRELIARHLLDMNSSLNEGDLIKSLEKEENRLFIMTVHKAKGLEFENVIVLSCIDGVYPHYSVQKVLNNAQCTYQEKLMAQEQAREDARRLYVAITRASKRICLSYSSMSDRGYNTAISPFIAPIRHFFLEGRRQ